MRGHAYHSPRMRRAFSETEAKEHRLLVEKKRSTEGEGGFYYLLNGSQRFEDGYLVKPVAVKSLVLEEALPPLDELQRFNQVPCLCSVFARRIAGCHKVVPLAD